MIRFQQNLWVKIMTQLFDKKFNEKYFHFYIEMLICVRSIEKLTLQMKKRRKIFLLNILVHLSKDVTWDFKKYNDPSHLEVWWTDYSNPFKHFWNLNCKFFFVNFFLQKKALKSEKQLKLFFLDIFLELMNTFKWEHVNSSNDGSPNVILPIVVSLTMSVHLKCQFA